MSERISLCMIVRNEEETLDRCLSSVRGAVDEIVVVDTGSTDSTVEVARNHAASVVIHKWNDDFSEARNLSLSSATGDWILVLDADEELTPESCARLREAVASTSADGLEVTVRSEMPPQDIMRYEDTKIVRLFRNRKEYRYIMPIHEQIRSSIENNGGNIIPSDLMISHHGYANATVQGGVNRGERNLKVLNAALSASPDNAYLHYQIGVTLMSIGKKADAYLHLRRVPELDISGFGADMLERLFVKLSQLALERNENADALKFARASQGYNPRNEIALYVEAIALLSMNRIKEGYGVLLTIRERDEKVLRVGSQLDQLINACEESLKS